MAIPAQCGKCGKDFSVKEALAGKRVKCPACGEAVMVPGNTAPEPAFNPFEAMVTSGTPTTASGTTKPVSKCKHCGQPITPGAVICMHCGYNATTGQMLQTSKSSGRSTMLSVPPMFLGVGGGLVAVVLIIIGYFALFGGPSTPDAPPVKPVAVATAQEPTTTPSTHTEVTDPSQTASNTTQQPTEPSAEELERQRQLEQERLAEEARQAELKRLAEERAAAEAAAAAKAAEEAAAKRAEHEAKVAAQRQDRADVNAAIDKGVAYLLAQYRGEGKFAGSHEKFIGQTALVVYALLKSGVSEEEKAIAESINPLLAYGLGQPGMDNRGTYNAGLVMMALDQLRERAEAAIADQTLDVKIRRQAIITKPKCIASIRRCVTGMYGNQKGNKSFSYGGGAAKRGHDMSIHQYALLGMWAAYRNNIILRPNYWNDQTAYLLAIQNPDGGWCYGTNNHNASSLAMTCAGIGSLAICQANTAKKRITRQTTTITDDNGLQIVTTVDIPAQTDAEKAIDRGFEWIARHGMETTFNPYYLYGLERAASLTGTTTINGINWYDTLSKLIVKQQRPDGSWDWKDNLGGPTCGTAWCLLFLRQSSLDYFNSAGEQNVDQDHTDGTPAPEPEPNTTPEPEPDNAPAPEPDAD